MCWYKSVKGFRSPEGCSYRIKDAEYMSVEGINSQYDPSDVACSFGEVPYAILNMHYGRYCLDYVKNIFTGEAVKVEHILDSSTFASSSGEQLYFEDYSYSTRYRPVRCMQTGEVMPMYLVKDSYRLPGELSEGDVVRDSEGTLRVILNKPEATSVCLLSGGRTSYPQFLHYVGKAELLRDGSYIYQDILFDKSASGSAPAPVNKPPKHELNIEMMKHRLTRPIINSLEQVIGHTLGEWVPYPEVASLYEYRAFHPDHTVPGLPQMFRIQE